MAQQHTGSPEVVVWELGEYGVVGQVPFAHIDSSNLGCSGSLRVPDRDALILRWGACQLNIIGRGALLAWAGVGCELLGLKHYWAF